MKSIEHYVIDNEDESAMWPFNLWTQTGIVYFEEGDDEFILVDESGVRYNAVSIVDRIETLEQTLEWLKAKNHQLQTIKREKEAMKASEARTVWPLMINPEMDTLVARGGFGHWSCTSTCSNRSWIRKDGEVATFENTNLIIFDFLKKFDKSHPMSDNVFGENK